MLRAAIIALLLLTSSAASAAGKTTAPADSSMALAGLTVSIIGAAGVIAGVAMAIAGGTRLSDTAAAYGCEGGQCPPEASDDEHGAVQLRDAGFVMAGLGLIPFGVGIALWVHGSRSKSGARAPAVLHIGATHLQLTVAF